MENINKTSAGKMTNSKEFADRKVFCTIREYGPKDSDKSVIFIGSLFHRTKYGVGNFQKIVNQHGAKYVHVDYPKTEFDIDKVRAQLIDFISKSKEKEIVLAGLSFGQTVIIDLIQNLPPEIKSRIKRNLSVAGVNDFDQLDKNQKMMVDKLSLLNRGFKRKLLGCLGWLDRKTNGPISHQIYYSHGTAPKSALENQRRAASLGITPGISDRLDFMRKAEAKAGITDIPMAVMYAPKGERPEWGDEMYTDPTQNAINNVLQSSNPNSIAIKVHEGKHAAFSEFPDKRDKYLIDFLEKTVGWQNQEPETKQ